MNAKENLELSPSEDLRRIDGGIREDAGKELAVGEAVRGERIYIQLAEEAGEAAQV